MQNTYTTAPHSEAPILEHTEEQSFTGRPLTTDLKITITEIALSKIVELKQRMDLPVKGLRVTAIPRSPFRSDYLLRFVPKEEAESPMDTILSFDDIDLHIAQDCLPFLEGATIDFVFSLIGSEFKVEAPLRKLDTPDSHIANNIQLILEEEINPSLASHGGKAILIDFKDGIVFLELKGGCQGCSMAGATLKDSIETSIRNKVTDVKEVRDVTNHSNGRNPYFQ